MKYLAQITCSLLFISIVIKSFFTKVNAVDAIILLSVTSIYAMYEFFMDKKDKQDFEEYKKITDKNFEALKQDIQNNRDYISKLTASQSLRR